MFIRSRNPEWSNGARAFMLRTAVSIVTASRCAPITRPTTSSGNGATAVAHRAIIFLSGQYLSGKCVWARILRTSARARRRNRQTPRPPEPQALQPHPPRREAVPHRPHQVPLRLAQIQVQQQTPVRLPRAHRVREQPHRLRQQVLLQRRQQRFPLHRRRARHHRQVRMRFPLRQLRQRRRMQARLHHQARQRDCQGPRRRMANQRCTPQPGSIDIFIRRALSTSTRTCRLIVFFIKPAASLMRLRPMP
jgi:hypothetical protein